MIPRALIVLSFLGFLAVGVALAANHFGFAIRIANYIFFILLLAVAMGVFTGK